MEMQNHKKPKINLMKVLLSEKKITDGGKTVKISIFL